MAFTITLNGQKIHEVDIDPRLVTGVRLHSATGEAGVAGSSLRGTGSDTIDLTLDIQQPTALPVVEDDARLAAEEANASVEVLVPNPNMVKVEEAVGQPTEGAETTESNPAPKAKAAAKAE